MKKALSLRTIYLLALTVVFAAATVAFLIFSSAMQQRQAEEALLEESRAIAREMSAVWSFMDNSQKTINTSADGDYDFKGLHCSIVGKSVGSIFSYKSDYKIRYTNFNPRNLQDRPDAFETDALNAFTQSSDTKEYYRIASFEGEERYRYLKVLEVDSGCLECHGEPVGELDITGNAKEGWTLDSIGGAISIVIPLDQQHEAMQENIVRNVAFFVLLVVVVGGIIFVITQFFVFNPLQRMKQAFGKMQEGQFGVSIDGSSGSREMNDLALNFNAMASQLNDMYENLEGQVAERTMDLQAANALLEQQRDSLDALSRQLAQESNFKSDLLSMINHELRTPLTAIITLAQVSRESCESEGRSDAYLWEEVENNGKVLLEMINNMLDMARSDAGKMTATLEPMDVGDIIESVRRTMMPLAQKYQVEFTTSVAPEAPLVKGDFEKTKRILENLVSNAIKFTPDGGHISITAGKGPDGSTHISVADDGIGIAPADQERIFEKFVQVDSTSTRKYNGSGLGLALVKEYASVQGYRVELRSTLGKGSAFVLIIPASLNIDMEGYGEDDG